jgi:HAD superfamily hydrolase (TIGR01459 family)
MQHLTGFAPLAQRYEGFIVDLWGVIHDGVTPYDGAIEALSQLRAMGKPVLLLSNAPRRAYVAREGLRAMGIDDALYHGILTSGEATHDLLRERTDPWFAALGRRVFHLGPERDRNLLDGLDIVVAAEPAAADLVLNTGPDDERSQIELADFEAILQACAASRLPMICANPDLEVIRGGVRLLCAGALALRYGELGGAVRWVGKPDPAIYVPALRRLDVPSGRVLAVGDSLRTDIAGAKAAGLDACWVLGGIHHESLQAGGGAQAVAAQAGLDPLACVPAFSW